MTERFVIIGAGLAGCECGLTVASYGLPVTIYEQKPDCLSPAHSSTLPCELVCSNSFRSSEPTSGVGLLKEEMRQLHSFIMQAADKCRIPAGRALAVDRKRFSEEIAEKIRSHPNIELVSRKIESLDSPELAGTPALILAAGPMLEGSLAASLKELTGNDGCYFYDAIAPIVWTDSLDHGIVFRASRYEEGSGDYFNCPMNREEYIAFHSALCAGKTFDIHDSEKHFEGCMPIEALAQRGPATLSFGPMKPVGLIDPRTGLRPWAVLQLRPEQANAETCNLVGCQTKLLQGEQKRIFGMVPGLASAEFARYGSMHRNTYVNAPEVLNADLSLRARPDIYLAGQITGVEGYVESAASGLWLGHYLARRFLGQTFSQAPAETALGALLAHLGRKSRHFQPSNATFGLMPEPGVKLRKKERKEFYSQRARSAFMQWLKTTGMAAL